MLDIRMLEVVESLAGVVLDIRMLVKRNSDV